MDSRKSGGAEIIRVAIIDDHYVVRVGLKTIIDMDPELQFAGEASSGEGAAAFERPCKKTVRSSP